MPHEMSLFRRNGHKTGDVENGSGASFKIVMKKT